MQIGRRGAIGAGLAALAMPAWARTTDDPALAAIRARTGGRLGVFAIDLASKRSIGLDADARYAMCSTFKLPLAAAVLHAADRGRVGLDQPMAFGAADLLDYAPVVKAHLAEGRLQVATLAEAAVVMSDNSAANLLLPLVGGPAGLTRFCRAAGDRTTRMDRTEPTLNTNLPGDPRDTTTPRAMAMLIGRLIDGDMLSAASRDRLIGWMVACGTGKARIRAGLPADWRAGDKTGTGERGACNDVAALWRPGTRVPILVACYVDAPDATADQRNAACAAVGRVVAERFG